MSQFPSRCFLRAQLLAALAVIVFAGFTQPAAAQQPSAFGDAVPEAQSLWRGAAPGAVGNEEADIPSIRVYRPDDLGGYNTGAAVVICPGGGYGALATDHEGHQVARWFARNGVTGVVLKYRLGPRYHHSAPLDDVSRAIRTVRHNAREWQVDPNRVGVMGFSAGGHLASTISTHFDAGDRSASDPIEKLSSRPDFSILAYPVISMADSYGHAGSRRNLLGENPDPKLVGYLSNETQVTDQTPPTFLFHTAEDPGVKAQNSLAYFSALLEHGVPAELHVYQSGPHGVGMAIGDPDLESWTEHLLAWLRGNGFLNPVKRVSVSGEVIYNGEPLRWGTITFEPRDPTAPRGWSMVRRGRFTVPAERGVAQMENEVIIRTLGDVQPFPTQSDVKTLTGPETRLRASVGPDRLQDGVELSYSIED